MLSRSWKGLGGWLINTVITSFTKEGYELYGLKCLDGLLQYWPQNVKFVVYTEGDIDCSYPKTDSRFRFHSIAEVHDLTRFLKAIEPFPLMSGVIAEGKYNINYDARMGRKSFMLSHALNIYGGKVVWLDADTVTHSKVPEDFINQVLPDDKMCCFLGRDGWYYTESGFLGYNSAHSYARPFASGVAAMFSTGKIFTYPGWHDCFAFDAVRKTMGCNPDWFNNLAKDVPHGTMHPFVNTVLGKYMDHRKGARKHSRSTEKDLVHPREEAYWKDSTARH